MVTAVLLDFTEKLLSYKIRQYIAQDSSKTSTSDSICGLYFHVLEHSLTIQQHKNKVNFLVNKNIKETDTRLFYGNDKLIRHETEIKQNNTILFNLTDSVN